MLGRTLVLAGIIIVVIGLVIILAPRIPFLGRLPGDIYYKKDDFAFYFPVTTSIVISIILSLIFYIFTRR
ncbi:MAG TPA: DUF2905 domain-containing protein [Thermodesulfobacteriota bacterium]|nr:DUF2905 domain-containing protein [Thermodesulfobacteriota bacterium]